ncbi:hypothetical protein HGI67_09550 [Clostridium beijerinckii]|nr:hypothetical protein [Clostridium beijerinckii]MBC2523197.1 hypothetical protein [Clostridium beijerinckii]NRV85570.1 hypothetical protein [Clostridium beijerinckii]
MHISRRNENYAVVPVSKEIMMDDSKLTSCTKMLASKASFELAYLEQLLI